MFKSLPVPLGDQSVARLTLRRRRAVAALVVGLLGVGSGVAGAVASVVAGTAGKGLPFAGADRLMLVAGRDTRSAALELEIPSRDVGRIRRETTSFSEIAIYSSYYAFVSAPEGATRTYGASEISSNLLPLLGVSPQLGRVFTPDDELAAAAPVALLGDRAWRELFGGDRRAVGSTLLVNGRVHQVVGVMPAGFAFPELQQLWLNLPVDAASGEPVEATTYSVLGRLVPGATRISARLDVGRLRGLTLADQRRGGDSLALTVESFTAAHTDPALRRAFGPMLLAVAGLLVLVCANATNLLVFRALSEQRAVALRVALGASRARLLSAALREALVLGLASALLGLGVAALLLHLFRVAMAPANYLRGFWVEIELNPTTVVVIVAVAFSTCALAQLVPLWRLLRVAPRSALAEGGGLTGRRAGRLSNALVVVQVALALSLLVGSGLLLGAIRRIHATTLPVAAEGLIVAKLSILQRPNLQPAEIRQFFAAVSEALGVLPGVRSVAFGSSAPTDGFFPGEIEVEGQELPLRSGYHIVGSRWFSTLGVGVLRGRPITDEDRHDTLPVAVVSSSFSRRLFGDGEPLGRRLRLSRRLGQSDPTEPWSTIVGVVPDLPWRGPGLEEESPTVYFPHAQRPRPSMVLAVATDSAVATDFAVESLLPQLGDAVAAVDRMAALFDARPFTQVLRRHRWALDSLTLLLVGLGGLALVLACLGTFAVVSVAAAERAPEMALRLALGAERGSVVRRVMGMALRPVVGGVVLGLGLAIAAGRLLSTLVFGVLPWDGLVALAVAALVVLVGAGAAWPPAIRASRTAPVSVLR